MAMYFVIQGNPPLEQWLRARADACFGGKMWFHHVCPKLSDGRCSIYDIRPLVCSEKKVSRENCAEVIEFTGGNVDYVFDI